VPTEKAHGIQIAKMCEAFASSNFEDIEMELIAPQRFNHIRDNPFEYYGIEKNFKIKKLFCLDLIPLDKFLGPISFWVESFTFSLSVFLYLLFKKSNFIYSRDLPPLFLLSFFKKNLFYEMHDFPLKFQRRFCQIIFKKIKGIITTNEWKKKEAQRVFGLRDDEIFKSFNGVDIGRFHLKETKTECRKKLGLAQDKKIVLYTGHLYSWKGVDVLTEVSQYLPKNIEIYFVGGTEKDIKRFKIQHSKRSDRRCRIQIVGHRPHLEIPYWLKSADVLVLPNTAKQDISKYWTSPLKMLEYMASGTPIVASDLPSVREIVDENSAFLVKPDDSLSLSQGIKKILQNTQLADMVSGQAFQNVQQYTWIKRAKKILNFVNKNHAIFS